VKAFTGINNFLKSRIYRGLGIAYNPYGVPLALAKHLIEGHGISVVDVGAHSGEFTRTLDLMCPIDHGLLVEAQPARAKELKLRFPPPRFEIVASALSDREGEINLTINQFDPTTSILQTRRAMPELAGIDVGIKEIVRCPVTTLDAVVSKQKFPTIDLLKLDVQGAEHLVLRGGHESLKRTRLLWTEVSFLALYEGACLFDELHAELTQLGFRLTELEGGFRGPDGELLQADALYIRKQ
jgi:FkbM family methyltransferase